MQKKMKHLDMIERVIERMGSNSFHLKGWAVTLVTVVGGFASQGTDTRDWGLVSIPLLLFWFLDSFYLQIERKYKILYKNVATKDEENIDFNMDTRKIVCDGEEADRISSFDCVFSKTECPFYLSIALVVVALIKMLIVN